MAANIRWRPQWSQGGGASGAAAVTAAVLLSLGAVGVPPAAADPGPAAGGAGRQPCAASASSVATAQSMARQCRRQVEAVDQRDEYARTLIEADGTATVERTVVPRWARAADGTWRDVDTTLRMAGGLVAPAATTVGVRLSAGGDGPLATVVDGAREISMSWPARLPRRGRSGPGRTRAPRQAGCRIRPPARHQRSRPGRPAVSRGPTGVPVA